MASSEVKQVKKALPEVGANFIPKRGGEVRRALRVSKSESSARKTANTVKAAMPADKRATVKR